MLFAIITAWLAYKRASENGRNGVLWGAVGVGVFIGIQLAVSLGAGVALGLGQAIYGWPDSIYDSLTLPITVVAIAFSFLGSWLLLKYLDRPLNEDIYEQAPPPPPDFSGGIQ